MDFVSNYVGELSASQFGGGKNGLASNIDLNDNTFENLLEKQLNNSIDTSALLQFADSGFDSRNRGRISVSQGREVILSPRARNVNSFRA